MRLLQKKKKTKKNNFNFQDETSDVFSYLTCSFKKCVFGIINLVGTHNFPKN